VVEYLRVFRNVGFFRIGMEERNRKDRRPMMQTVDGTLELATELEMRIRVRLGGQIRDFRVVCREEGLVLQGRSRTYYAKQLAQHVVMEVTSIPIIANEIEVY
jgi:osmotically-inducible protein OsmY